MTAENKISIFSEMCSVINNATCKFDIVVCYEDNTKLRHELSGLATKDSQLKGFPQTNASLNILNIKKKFCLLCSKAI
jgi:hypothetical protein